MEEVEQPITVLLVDKDSKKISLVKKLRWVEVIRACQVSLEGSKKLQESNCRTRYNSREIRSQTMRSLTISKREIKVLGR